MASGTGSVTGTFQEDEQHVLTRTRVGNTNSFQSCTGYMITCVKSELTTSDPTDSLTCPGRKTPGVLMRAAFHLEEVLRSCYYGCWCTDTINGTLNGTELTVIKAICVFHVVTS